jgi:monofunctional biosynthetic peptidoglycan transglycosylase
MRHLLRWLLWALALVLTALVVLQGWYATHIWWWRDHPPRETAFMAMRLAEQHERRADARLSYQWVPYERISLELKRAMIAAEDAKFVDHEGFDWDGGGASLPAARRSASSSPRTCFSPPKKAIGERARKR